MQVHRTLISLAATCIPLVASAADYPGMDMKSGLWESTVTTSHADMGPIPPEALARLTPEQRARIEAMRAGGPFVHRSCVTNDPQHRQDYINKVTQDSGDCQKDVVSSSRTEMTMHLVCTNKHGTQMDGTVHFVSLGPDHYKVDSNMKASGNQNMSMTTMVEGRWIGPDCGDVK